jgi:hypothetical protein
VSQSPTNPDDPFAKSFLKNAENARECGYDLCCSYCGEGLASDDFDDPDSHDSWCPTQTEEFRGEREKTEREFAERLARIREGGAT